MRRYVFYPLIALLAFGISSFVAFKLCWKTKNVLQKNQETVEVNIATQNFGDVRSNIEKNIVEIQSESQHEDKQKTIFTCRDKLLSLVFEDLKKERTIREELEYYLEDKNPADCKDILEVEKSVDLNNDGKKEIVIRGQNGFMCGATGNCSFWIYQSIVNKYEKILETGGETLEVKKKTKNGYKNIFVRVHDSCCSSYLVTYKFSDGKYKESNCLFEDYGTTGERSIMTCTEKTKQSQEQLQKTQK